MKFPVNTKVLHDVSVTLTKILSLLTCLFFFICSLSFLSDSFRILGGKNIGALFSDSDLLKNPIVGLMIGVLVTVLVQSSSTSTSIIVGLVAANVNFGLEETIIQTYHPVQRLRKRLKAAGILVDN